LESNPFEYFKVVDGRDAQEKVENMMGQSKSVGSVGSRESLEEERACAGSVEACICIVVFGEIDSLLERCVSPEVSS
jgi:hypothetical protein